MSAFSKNKKTESQMLGESPEEILRRKRALESRVGNSSSSSDEPELTGLAAEKPMGTVLFLPKSLHRIASRYAEDMDMTAKRFFFETFLLGLEQQGVITPEQRTDALTLPNDYGWKGRKVTSSSDSSD